MDSLHNLYISMGIIAVTFKGCKYRIINHDEHVINMQVFPPYYTQAQIDTYPLPKLGPDKMEQTCEEREQEAEKRNHERRYNEALQELNTLIGPDFVGSTVKTSKNGLGHVATAEIVDRGSYFLQRVTIEFESGIVQFLSVKEAKMMVERYNLAR